MLYDPKWAPAETKRGVFNLAQLIGWLEQQPSSAEYDWTDIHGCLLCAFLKANGFEDPAGELGFGPENIADWGPGGYGAVAHTKPWTFGAALERARAAQSL